MRSEKPMPGEDLGAFCAQDESSVAKQRHTVDVVLASMPFGPLFTPSIALGLLSSELRRAGFSTSTHYFTVPFSTRVGARLYGRISSGFPEGTLLVGDWLFRDALFGAAGPAADDAYINLLAKVMSKQSPSVDAAIWQTLEEAIADLTAIRGQVGPFLDACTETILADDPAVVGFTTVFQQNVASLALSKRLKARSPNIRIVFGGANCEAVMGSQMLASFPQIDHVVSGEGEKAIVELATTILRNPAETMPARHARDAAIRTSASAVDLNELSYPDYDSYFEQIDAVPDIDRRARILFETSRGCWWGERSHCTFCGLNGTNMVFRSKAASRAYRELEWLMSKYGERPISVVDNILDLKYFNTFIPMLREWPLGAELFYEVKANLTKEQIRQLKAAGISLIQPGIESLHDGVLRIMKKGVGAIQNLQLLKWSAELGVKVLWNFIWGFPGEKAEWYQDMRRLFPLVTHLQPPGDGSNIRLDRFSPLFNDVRLGAVNVQPFPAYRSVYAELPDMERFNLAYYFTFERVDRDEASDYTGEIQDAIVRWNEIHDRCGYFFLRVDGQILLFDLRDPASVDLHLLNPLETRLYKACDGAKTVLAAHRELADPSVTVESCADCLRSLASDGTMVEIQGKYLSLAIEMNQNVPSVAALQRLQVFFAENNRGVDNAVSEIPLTNRAMRTMV